MASDLRSSSLEPEEGQVELPGELAALSLRVDERPESFATGNKDIQLAALQAAKYVFDLALKSEANSRAQIAELLNSLSPTTAPETRSQAKKKKDEASQKAKQGPKFEETSLPELCIDGMDEGQVWAQMELRAQNLCKVLEYALEGTGVDPEEGDGEGASLRKGLFSENGVQGDLDPDAMDVDMDEDESEDESLDDEDDEDDEESEESHEDDGSEPEGAGEEAVVELRDPSDDEDELDLDAPTFSRKKRGRSKAGGHSQLDDGFFDLAAFNAETEEAESRAVSKGRLSRDEDSEDEDADLEDVDMFGPVNDVEDDGQEPFYKDFFAPPSRAPLTIKIKKPATSSPKSKGKGSVRFHNEVRVKNIKAKGKSLPLSVMYGMGTDDDDDGAEALDGSVSGSDEEGEEKDSEDDDEMELGEEDGLDGSVDEDGSEEGDFSHREAIERLKDDLFADEEDEDASGLTAYEKRQEALAAEIAALEAENVASKHWTLMGEATSKSRPQNALLEEDLDFERIMKAVPVITEETVQGLEERIKARIIEDRFDDVVRKRPVDDKPFLPSRFFELQDTKSKQSLAEIYEDEYTKTKAGTAGADDRDGKLAKEHEEIDKQWADISYRLDALCNAHFTPKAPKASISTIANVSAASLESALPTTKATSSMLAPEEVFAASSSDLRARSELTPTQKRALHNKEKKAKKKQRDAVDKSVDKFSKTGKGGSSVKKQKEAALKGIVKNGKGVTVIGKKSKELDKGAKATKGKS